MKPESSSAEDRAAGPVLWAVHVATLAAFAFAQPLYNLLGREPAFFIAHDTRPWGLALFALVLVLAPAAILWTASVPLALAGRRPAGARRFLVVAFLVGLTLLPPIHRSGIADGLKAILLAAPAAIAAGLWYQRFAAARTLVTLLSPAAMLFPALFLLTSPVAGLMRPTDTAAPAGPAVDATTPVVVVVFDELPLSSLLDADEQIDAVRYPGFADLARHGSWYRNATSVSAFTHYAVPAILTGNYPQDGKYATIRDHPQNLFTWLAGSYELQVVEPVTRLCPDELISDRSWRSDPWQSWRTLLVDSTVVYAHILLPPKLTTGLGDLTLRWKGFTEATVDPRREILSAGKSATLLDRLLKMIESGSRSDSTLYFVHLIMPHFPWKRLPSGKEYGPIGTMVPYAFDPNRFGSWGDDEWLVTQSYQRHLLQVGYSDRLLNNLLVKLRQAGLYDRALIVVTADHGFNFKPGVGIRSSERVDLLQDVMAVPLFIKRPGQTQSEVNELPVEHVDILPTIAAELGVELPWPVDGRPVSDPAVAQRRRKVIAEGGHGAPINLRKIDVGDLAGRLTLDHKLFLFGSGEDDIFAIGPHLDLLGQPADALVEPPADSTAPQQPAEAAMAVELTDAWTYDQVDPGGRFLPVNVTGTIAGERPPENGAPPVDLAVAVNGRIRATTRTFIDRLGELRFAAMVPESSFRTGRNQVEVYLVATNDSGRWLIPAEGKTSSRRELRLVATADGGDELRTAKGAVLRCAPERIRGHAQANAVFFYGWAADLEDPDRPVEVVVFFGDKPVAQTRADRFFPFVAVDQSLGLRKEVTYQLTVPFSMLPEATTLSDLRIFALTDAAAAELEIQFEEQFKAAEKTVRSGK